MILLVSFLISLITLISPCVVSNTSPAPAITKNNVITANIVESTNLSDGLNTLYFNGHNHYLGLDESNCFAVSSNDLYYSTDTALYSYSFQNKTLTKILDCDNIVNISYSHNQLFVFKDNKLYKVISNALVEYKNCDMYSIYYENNTTYLSMISGNTFTTIRIDSLSEVELWSTSIPVSHTPKSIANNNNTAFIVTEQNSSTMILEMNFQQKTTGAYTYYFPNITNLHYWKTVDSSSVLTFYTGENLRTIKRQPDSESYIDVYTKVLYGHGKHGMEVGLFYTIKDFAVSNNELYILDNIYSSIQKFEYSTDITFAGVVASSSAYSDGKFYNPQTFDLINKETIVVADTHNQAIQLIDGSTSTLIKNYTSNTTKTNFNYVSRVIKTNTNYYVLQYDILDNYEILILDNNFNLIHNVSHNLTNILDIALINNHLYILDGNTNALYRYSNNIIENTNISITLNTNSKMHYIIETNTLAITNNDIVYFVSIQNNDVVTYTHNENINSVSSDYMGNAYLLSNNKITRLYSLDTNDNTKKVDITLANNNFTHMSIEKETGMIYLFNSKNQSFEVLKSNKTYALGTDYNHPIDITEYTSNTVVNIGTTNSNVYVYTYPYNTGIAYDISNKTVYILDKVNNYYYVAYRHYNVDTYSNLGLGYISKDSIIDIKTYIQNSLPQNYKVLSDTAIYPLPNMLQSNNTVLTIGSLEKGTIIRSDYILIESTYTIDGCDYYVINTDNGLGYVKKVDLVSVKANQTEEILKPNAKLAVSEDRYNGVYIYAGNSSIVIDKLLVGQEVYVENYDINEKYTYIRYLDKNNIEHGGYVLTKCIKMNENSETNIGAIILIVLATIAVAGITTFYIISYRKQQKELTNNTKNDYE